MEVIYEGEQYSIENLTKHCKIYWSPATTNQQRRNVKSDLLCQRPGELVLDFRRIDRELKLHDISTHTPHEITTCNLRQAITKFYEDIRNCTCHYDNGQLSVFSEQKKIDVTIKFWDETRKLAARGDEENLIRFIHAYCDSMNLLSSNATYSESDTTLLASIATLKPNTQVQDLLEIKCIPLDNTTNIPQVQAKLTDNAGTTTTTEAENLNNSQIPPPDSSTTDKPTTTTVSPPRSKDIQDILDQLSIIPELKVTLDNLNNSIDNINLSIKKLDARVFDAERNIQKNSDRLQNIEQSIDKLKTQTVKQCTYDKTIQAIQSEQKSLTNELSILKTKIAASGPSSIDKDEIQNIAREVIRTEFRNQPSNDRREKYKQTASTDELNHELLIVGDSNTHYIKESILKHGMSAAKFTAYKIDQAVNTIDDMKIISQPSKILINVGTNEFSSAEKDTNDLTDLKAQFEDLFGLLQRKFPESEIWISEIFIRKEKCLEEDINEINDYLKTACRHRPNFSLLTHRDNIHDRSIHLEGNRHLSQRGFSLFLFNIRTQMLKMIPKMPSPTHRYRQDQRNHGGHNNRFQGRQQSYHGNYSRNHRRGYGKY